MTKTVKITAVYYSENDKTLSQIKAEIGGLGRNLRNFRTVFSHSRAL